MNSDRSFLTTQFDEFFLMNTELNKYEILVSVEQYTEFLVDL